MRLGILSRARIGILLMRGAALVDDVQILAVASRSEPDAIAFAREHDIPRAHGSYEELLADPDVDAVYVPLPNALHAEWTLRALEAGKHVLCEKPFSPRPEDVERCWAAADTRGLVLAEAFMWRHHPQARRLEELVREGAIGELRLVRAAFSFSLDRPGDIRWDPALDGGSLLDVGCYCVSAARMLAGEPVRVACEAVLRPDGVDARVAGTLRFAGDVLATFDCGFDLPGRDELEAIGSEGSLFLDDPWHAREPAIELRRDGRPVEHLAVSHADPYACELEDFARAVRDGVPPLLGRADALGQARTLAALLRSGADGGTAITTEETTT